MKRKIVQQKDDVVWEKKRRRSPLSPFARSSAMLSMKRTAAEPVAVSEIFWEDLRPSPETWLPGPLNALMKTPSAEGRISRPRPYDIDGKAIFVDEHDAPFVLLASGEQVYVHIFRSHLAGDEILLTMPDANPQKRYLPPEERARRALGDLAQEVRNRKLLAG